jgi:ribosomal protein L11 methyltransferase
LRTYVLLKSAEFKIEYTEEIDPINWNEEEKNFEAIDVEGNCHVRAFHPKLMLNLTF